jgi:hypothetical protein
MDERSASRDPSFSKRAPRVGLRRGATLVHEDGNESAVTIVDVSSGGFRLEVSDSPRIGAFVTLRVEKGEGFPAQIRWALGNEAGGVFLAPVNYAEW